MCIRDSIHAEGYPAAEMKHGPIALIDEDMPTIVIATNKINYDKIVSNIQEIKSRKGKICAIVSKGDKEVKSNYETFVLGDDRDPTDDEMEILKSFDKLKIGETSLLTSACITLIHHFLDE